MTKITQRSKRVCCSHIIYLGSVMVVMVGCIDGKEGEGNFVLLEELNEKLDFFKEQLSE